VVDERIEALETRVEGLSRRLQRLETAGEPAVEATPRRWPQDAPRPAGTPPPRGRVQEAPRPAATPRSLPSPWAAPARAGAGPLPAPAARPSPGDRMRDALGGRSLEDLLGGRVLAWVGGLAVLIGVAFLFAVAVSQGWIGEGMRTLFAGAGSGVLLGLGIWLHEHRGRTDAALAAVATGVSALFVTVTVAAQVYELLPAVIGLVLALGIGSLATGLAVRWEARGIAALGILGALLSPVLAGAPPNLGTMAILFVAAGCAVAVLLRQQWEFLSFGVFLIAVPQWVGFLFTAPTTIEALAVLIAFGAVGAAAAVGHEVLARGARSPAPEPGGGVQRLHTSSAFLLALNGIVLAVAGWFALGALDQETIARLWLGALAVVHLAIGMVTIRSGRGSRDFGLLAMTIGVVVADVAFALAVDGPGRAVGFAAAGVLFAALVHRGGLPSGDASLTSLGLGVHVALGLLQALVSDAPLGLVEQRGSPGFGAAASLVAVAAGCFVSARLAEGRRKDLRVVLDSVGLAVVAYLTVLSLDGTQLVLAFALEAVVLAQIGRRAEDSVAVRGAYAHLALALGQALINVAGPWPLGVESIDLLGAAVSLGAVSAAALVLARTGPREDAGCLDGLAAACMAYLAVVLLDGPALPIAWAAGSVVLTVVARESRSVAAARSGLAYLGLALGYALVFQAAPAALVEGLAAPGAAAAVLAAVALAAGVASRCPLWKAGPRQALAAQSGLVLLYLASVLVVTPFQPGGAGEGAALLDLEARQQGQVLLSGLWSLVGFAALVVGLRRDIEPLRLAALTLLLVTVAKVFLFDLATLTSVYRVVSFIALGLLLLAAAFVWQRMRPGPLPDMREAPEGIR